MNRYFLHLAYNGKAYHGWQIQPGDISVQEVLEKCISLKLKQDISVTGCGRTDTGVNARNFYAHFESEPINDLQTCVNQLNMFLPDDIVVYRCWQVDPYLHARFDAKSRTYHYYVTRTKNPFHTDDALYIYGPLDVEWRLTGSNRTACSSSTSKPTVFYATWSAPSSARSSKWGRGSLPSTASAA